MSNLITPGYFTELSAVNYVLRAIGEAPLSTLTNATQADVAAILGCFNDVAAEVLAMDQWKFNSEIGYQLQPAGQLSYVNTYTGDTELLNVFAVPPTMAAYWINPNYSQSGISYVDLGFRQATTFNQSGVYPIIFYDRRNNREGFNAAAYPFLALDVRWFTPFVNLPYMVQLWICARTARRTVEQGVNSGEIAGFVKADEAMAFRHVVREYSPDDTYNALRTVNAFRAYGNRPATNVGFIDIRGLAPAMTLQQVTLTPCTIASYAVTEYPSGSYTTSFTVSNPNALAVNVALSALSTGVVSTVTAPTATAQIPANASLAVDLVYTLGAIGGSGTIVLSATTSTVGDSTQIGTQQSGTATITSDDIAQLANALSVGQTAMLGAYDWRRTGQSAGALATIPDVSPKGLGLAAVPVNSQNGLTLNTSSGYIASDGSTMAMGTPTSLALNPTLNGPITIVEVLMAQPTNQASQYVGGIALPTSSADFLFLDASNTVTPTTFSPAPGWLGTDVFNLEKPTVGTPAPYGLPADGTVRVLIHTAVSTSIARLQVPPGPVLSFTPGVSTSAAATAFYWGIFLGGPSNAAMKWKARLIIRSDISQADVDLITAWAKTQHSAIVDQNAGKTFFVDGDSISQGSELGWTGCAADFASGRWGTQMVNDASMAGWADVNVAVDGYTTTNIMAQYFLDPILPRYKRTKAVLCLLIGTNDLVAGTSAATVFANIQTICQHYKTTLPSLKIVVGTILPRSVGSGGGLSGSSFDNRRLALNTLIKAGDPNYYDAVADIASDATMGAYATVSNATYYNNPGGGSGTKDGVHPTAAGAALIYPYFKTAVLSF